MLSNAHIPVIGFTAYSGTGKTTLLEHLIPVLRERGYRLGLIKHGHHDFDIDHPGKDSYRLRKAGAQQTLVASAQRWALIQENQQQRDEPHLNDLLSQLNQQELDLILVEGFKHEAFTRIELHRPSLCKPLLYKTDPHIIAVASDQPLTLNLPVLDINRAETIADFIEENLDQFAPGKTMTDTTSPQSGSCQDDYDPNSLTMEQAYRRIESSVEPIRAYDRLFIRQALNRILAEDILSSIDVPAYTNSAMDGYAIRSQDLPQQGDHRLKVVGKVFAGHPFSGELNSGECVRIMTGAPMPTGADTVIMQEHVSAEGEMINFSAGHQAGQNVRQAGEDIAKGSVVLAAGRRLSAADIGLLASLGVAEVTVTRKLRAAFFSTGDELRSLGQALESGQIYDSNRYTLFSMLSRLDIQVNDMGIIPDRRESITEALSLAAENADVVITTGGVSVGEADFIKEILEELGQVNFWKIAMKPGRPLAYGKIGNALFFGLPGNPVSAMVTFYQYLQPALRRLMGETELGLKTIRLPTVSRLKKRPGRVEFQRGILIRDEHGELAVKSTGDQGSHILSSMAQADCFIILPMDSKGAEAGDRVEVQLFQGLI